MAMDIDLMERYLELKKPILASARLAYIGIIIFFSFMMIRPAVAHENETAIEISPEADAEEASHDQGTSESINAEGGFLTDPSMIEKKQDPFSFNRTFPLWKSIVKDRALPRPVSLGIVAFWQTQDYDIVSANVGYGPISKDIDVSGTTSRVETKSLGVKLGLWLFPFLNLHGGGGYSYTDSPVLLRDAPISVTPGPGAPTVTYGDRYLELSFDGSYWNLGMTVAGGWNRWFGSLTFNYGEANLDSSKDFIGTNTFTSERILPKFGYSFHGTSVWVGAAYMDEEMHKVGTLDGFSYDVLVTRTDWTPVVGMNTILGEHWEMTVEGGFGDRTSAMFNLGYRF